MREGHDGADTRLDLLEADGSCMSCNTRLRLRIDVVVTVDGERVADRASLERALTIHQRTCPGAW